MIRSLSFRKAWPSSAGRARDAADRPGRLGVIDIGSNSVRLVAFASETRSPTVCFNEKALCGLGADLAATGRLSERGKDAARAALQRYLALAARMDLDGVAAIGTAALRDAEDGPDFVAEIERDLGLSIEVASGADEARLAAQGVLLGDPRARGVVADLGGASLELVRIEAQAAGEDGGASPPSPSIGAGVSMPLGPLRLRAIAAASGDGDAGSRAVEIAVGKILKTALAGEDLPRGETLYLLGGSCRALARLHMAETNYPLHVLHGFSLDLAAAEAMTARAQSLTPMEIKERIGVSESRAAVTPFAALAIGRVLRALAPKRIVLSAFGLREGVLWERMPAALRAVDPLLDACAAQERMYARAPGFGSELWAWLEPVLDGRMGASWDARLGQAACLLAETLWRTHPDYRSQASFELVTRNNFGGVSHADRLFIGAALMFRFKGAKRAIRAIPAMAALTEDATRAAERLGKGMRLGAALAASMPGVLPQAGLRFDDASLSVRLGHDVAMLSGEEITKRLVSFAQSLGCEDAKASAVAAH